MNNAKYQKESFHLNHLVQQVLDFLDRVRTQLEDSTFTDNTGRRTNDSMDIFKQNFYRLLQRVANKAVTFDFLYQTNQFFTTVRTTVFNDDPTILQMLGDIEKSLHNLFHIINEVPDEYYEEDNENED